MEAYDKVIAARAKGRPTAIAYIRANPDEYPYWMPIPQLLEVEE